MNKEKDQTKEERKKLRLYERKQKKKQVVHYMNKEPEQVKQIKVYAKKMTKKTKPFLGTKRTCRYERQQKRPVCMCNSEMYGTHPHSPETKKEAFIINTEKKIKCAQMSINYFNFLFFFFTVRV